MKLNVNIDCQKKEDKFILQFEFNKKQIQITEDLFLKTIISTFIICFLWMGLELLFYHEVQKRVVDDILLLILIPFIYHYFQLLKNKKEKNYDKI